MSTRLLRSSLCRRAGSSATRSVRRYTAVFSFKGIQRSCDLGKVCSSKVNRNVIPSLSKRACSAGIETSKEKFSAIRLADYKPPPFAIDTINLNVEVKEGEVIVTNEMTLSNLTIESAGKEDGLIRFHGDKSLECLSVSINGKEIAKETAWQIDAETGELCINKDWLLSSTVETGESSTATLAVSTRINPFNNRSCEGFYQCGHGGDHPLLVTQCEPEGFRKITYFLDRTDVMSEFTVTLNADSSKYPTLISNGDCVSRETIPSLSSSSSSSSSTITKAKFVDRWKKPTYLFAMVCGDLQHLHERYEGVDLYIHCEKHIDLKRCEFAMKSLKMAMKWDMDVFGLKYDCNEYHIVVADHFNMGAMENKTVNIFNSRYVLCDSDTATDNDFMNVLRVVAHEYFHNYTGNRVTLRDWFQLSLKEGLTVYREQEFFKDVSGFTGVSRIGDVTRLQNAQFKEDSSAMSHPVRPDSYMEINNFYTPTVYEKGAEVIRVLESIVGGRDQLVGACKHYLSKHDGQACTVEDFVLCLKEYIISESKKKTGQDCSQTIDRLDRMIDTWYSTAGTPTVTVTDPWFDEDNETFSMTLSQSINGKPSQMPIPLKLALLSRDRADKERTCRRLPLFMKDSGSGGDSSSLKSLGLEHTLILDEPKQTFVFDKVNDAGGSPMISLNRGFSSPIYLTNPSSLDDLLMAAVRDIDSYSRWEASNKLLSIACIDAYMNVADGRGIDRDTGAFTLPQNSSDKARECVQRLINPFVPKRVLNEMKAEVTALRKKELMRKQRTVKMQGSVPDQFLMDDTGQDLTNEITDLTHEVFLEDLIGDEMGDQQPLDPKSTAIPKSTAKKSIMGRNPLLVSRQLQIPSFDYLFPLISSQIGEDGEKVRCDPVLLASVLEFMKTHLSSELFPHLLNSYIWSRDQLASLSLHPQFSNNSFDGLKIGRAYRGLLNISLGYLMSDFGLTPEMKSVSQLNQAEKICLEQYQLARNMTEMMGALSAISQCVRPGIEPMKQDLFGHFYKHFSKDTLVLQRWFQLQALSNSERTLNDVIALLDHPAYDSTNPNFIYSLVLAYSAANPLNFHRSDGQSYHFIASQVLYHERENPSVAARICKSFQAIDGLDRSRLELIHGAIETILAAPDLSKGTFEICQKITEQIESKLK